MATKKKPPQTFEAACRDNLMLLANAYSKATDLSMATVSRQFYGKHGFFDELARGVRSITLAKVEEMLASFAAVWPKGVEVPALWPVPMRLGTKVPK